MLRLIAALAMFSATGPALAQGKQLHDAACMQCHASLAGGNADLIYTKADRKIASLEALEKRVGYCAVAAGVNWSAAQQRAVVDYLNRQFYKF